MSKIGILNTIPEAPVKPLVQDGLELYPQAGLVNPPEEYLNGQHPDEVPEELIVGFRPETFDRVLHDGDWQRMSTFSREFIKRALEGGATIQIVNGRKGE